MSIYEEDIWPMGMHPGGIDLTLKIVKKSNLQRGSRILDVGCGTGESAYMLNNMGFNVVGIDISETLIKKAKDKLDYKNIQFILEDVKNLSFPNEYFDAVLCECVLSCLDDFNLSIDNLTAVLKREGKLLISDICVKSSYKEFLKGFSFEVEEIQLAEKEWKDFINYILWNFHDLHEFKDCISKSVNLKDISYFYGIYKKI